jgi:hypothetical protein
LKGKVIASGLEARDIKCSGSPPFDATVAQQGTVATIVDGTRFTMNLGTGGSTTVTFNANTFVRGIALNGATGAVWAQGLAIEVEGSYTDATRTVFAATKIKFNSTP